MNSETKRILLFCAFGMLTLLLLSLGALLIDTNAVRHSTYTLSPGDVTTLDELCRSYVELGAATKVETIIKGTIHVWVTPVFSAMPYGDKEVMAKSYHLLYSHRAGTKVIVHFRDSRTGEYVASYDTFHGFRYSGA